MSSTVLCLEDNGFLLIWSTMFFVIIFLYFSSVTILDDTSCIESLVGIVVEWVNVFYHWFFYCYSNLVYWGETR